LVQQNLIMTRSFLKISALVLCSLNVLTAKAQQEIVQKAIDKIKSAQNISYTATISGEEFGGPVHLKTNVHLYNRQDNGNYEFYNIDQIFPSEKISYIDDGNQQLELYFKDSTYVLLSERKQNSSGTPLIEAVLNAEELLNKKKDRYNITMLTDSTINKEYCYHVLFATKNATNESYFKYHLFISKKSSLILTSRDETKGTVEKGGVKGGVMSMDVLHVYSDIHISNASSAKPVKLVIPQGFKPPVKSLPLLDNGTVAPQWTLTSTDGKTLSLNDMQGKVVLLEFTFNGCPACMMALPSLEKLHKKYDGSDVAIVSVNFLDSKGDVADFIKRNKVNSPIYINGKTVSKSYHVSAGPTFYLIDKKGRINWSEPGYFEDFENKMTASIEALR